MPTLRRSICLGYQAAGALARSQPRASSAIRKIFVIARPRIAVGLPAMSQKREGMKHRRELFSDAVFAIIITVMLLELRVPESSGWSGWRPLIPALVADVVTFVFRLVVWLAHDHMFSRVRVISRGMFWANGLCLLVSSLIPLALRNFVNPPKDS